MDFDEAVQRFHKLFAGRVDAYGGDSGRAIYESVDTALIRAHLTGDHEPIGIYPIRFVGDSGDETPREALRVRWGCCDIDTGAWDEAYRLATALRAMGLHPWVERSRSKGWHIWVFVTPSVAAFEMRRCLKVAYSAIDLAAKEANPKSELLRPSQLGNYVRLPYPGQGAPDRQKMMVGWGADTEGAYIELDHFLGAEGLYSDRDKIIYWSTKWHEPRRREINFDAKLSAELEVLVGSLPKACRTLYEMGPKIKEGRTVEDTSSGLVALARMLATQGWLPSDTYSVVVAADHRWGKYHERINPNLYYEDIVRRAYEG